MVVEWLSFEVPESEQARFIDQDAAIWTETLATQPGYLRKEVWRERNQTTRLHLAIFWASRAAWHAVPSDILRETADRFSMAMGRAFPPLCCIDYDIIER
jgi:uncharacterized protein (TIGR03792 family)